MKHRYLTDKKKMNGFSSIERILISLWGVGMPDSSHLTISAEWNLLTAHSHKHTLGLILICSMHEWGFHPLDKVSYLLSDNGFVLCHSKYRCNSCTGKLHLQVNWMRGNWVSWFKQRSWVFIKGQMAIINWCHCVGEKCKYKMTNITLYFESCWRKDRQKLTPDVK